MPPGLAAALIGGKPAAQPMRVVPDVAMDADPMTGFMTGATQKLPSGAIGYAESTIGGTSLATPLFAGLMADAEQAAGHPFGFLNPALYDMARSSAFHDVSKTSLGADTPRRRRRSSTWAWTEAGAPAGCTSWATTDCSPGRLRRRDRSGFAFQSMGMERRRLRLSLGVPARNGYSDVAALGPPTANEDEGGRP